MIKYILRFTLLFVNSSLYLQAQNHISFFEEHIDFELDTDYFIINCIYSFYNDAEKDINQQIIFPFGDKTATIDSIRIINLSTGRNIRFIKQENSVHFNIMVPKKDSIDVNIFYRQRISIVNKYVITSTQTWGKPLNRAVYTLTNEKNLKIKSISHSYDSGKLVNNKKLYSWEKHNFMPDYDFEITIDK